MRKLRVGFSRPKGKTFPIFAWLIMLYERTPFSHVYIRWETKWETWLCYHAASIMIHFLGETSFAKHIHIVEEFEFGVTDEQFDRLMRFCTKYVGADYAISEVLKIPLWDLGVTAPSTDDPWKQFCAELVLRAFGEMDGKELTLAADRVRLKTVYNFVKEKYQNGAKV